MDQTTGDVNQITVDSYEKGVAAYVSGTSAELSDTIKDWIDRTLEGLSKDARILEIGSAFGRDAGYIESRGFKVVRTDAAKGFVRLMQKKGLSAHIFNVLTDPFAATYDLIFANAVFLHFTREQLRVVLKKIHGSLSQAGILSFSVKKGDGEEWSQTKLGLPRYFCYWRAEPLVSLVRSVGLDLIEISEDDRFLRVISSKS